ncbi:hypothetical protein [Demequina lutea]|uniref:Uncharacterized protein n=1 Tax=Demequina lutea TaxID=431489 RepID=A0A7Z0CI16_9MICO|nr:hypothetical protein [Demequina lutea]NYI41414.1 hypothetical protein [Demequina lutea]
MPSPIADVGTALSGGVDTTVSAYTTYVIPALITLAVIAAVVGAVLGAIHSRRNRPKA